jgi:hypothetical protein
MKSRQAMATTATMATEVEMTTHVHVHPLSETYGFR